MRMLITPGGKHPARKWAELAADEIVHVSEQGETTIVREAKAFRNKLIDCLEKHHQVMMDDEQALIKDGQTDLDAPYQTADYAAEVRDEICGDMAKGTSFEKHFAQDNVRAWVAGICNKYFQSAKMVERQHFHSEKAEEPSINKKKKK